MKETCAIFCQQICEYFSQIVHVIADDLGDGLGPVGKTGRGEDWWYEIEQVDFVKNLY